MYIHHSKIIELSSAVNVGRYIAEFIGTTEERNQHCKFMED
jgi:hypothetical protein